jgi:acyl-CoA thioesterase-1
VLSQAPLRHAHAGDGAGGNDMLQRIDASVTAANLRGMVQVARDRGVAVVLIGVPKPPLFTGSVDEVIAREFDIPLENEIMASLFYYSSTKSDAVHPNAAGYRRMAEALAGLLRSAGAVE